MNILKNKGYSVQKNVFTKAEILKFEKNLKKSSFAPKKMSVVICFHFNKKRIKNLILTGGLSQLGGMFGGASTPQQEFGV